MFMFYTIRLQSTSPYYDVDISTPFETYTLSMPSGYALIKISQGDFDYWTYDDSSKNYRFFKETGEEVEVELSDELKQECDSVLLLYHSTFDADQVNRAKERVKYHLQVTFPFKDVYNNDIYFISSYGFKVKGDWYYKEYLKDVIDGLTDDTTILFDYDNQTHNLTKEQLQHLYSELIENLKYVEQQRLNFLAEIDNKNSVDELNELQMNEFNYQMKDFRALKG